MQGMPIGSTEVVEEAGEQSGPPPFSFVHCYLGQLRIDMARTTDLVPRIANVKCTEASWTMSGREPEEQWGPVLSRSSSAALLSSRGRRAASQSPSRTARSAWDGSLAPERRRLSSEQRRSQQLYSRSPSRERPPFVVPRSPSASSARLSEGWASPGRRSQPSARRSLIADRAESPGSAPYRRPQHLLNLTLHWDLGPTFPERGAYLSVL